MRILHIASGDFFSTYGGGQVYVKNVIDCMIELKYNVAVLSCVLGSAEITKRSYKGIDLYEISDIAQLEAAIKLAKPDVIHAHSFKAPVCIIANKLRIKTVVTSHHGGILCPAGSLMDVNDRICTKTVSHKNCLACVLRNIPGGKKLWYPVMRFVPEMAYKHLGTTLKGLTFIPFITPIGTAANTIAGKKRQWNDIAQICDGVIAPSTALGEILIKNGLSRKKLRVVPHGIPIPHKRPSFPLIVDGKIKFYFVGRICYIKGLHVLLEAFNSINNPKIELHLIGGTGNKKEERYMKVLQRKYSDDRRIFWHGKLPPEAIYSATMNYHVSVAPTICLEAFGLNIAEALAMGKPVLATISGGAEMQVKDGINGWLVPPNSVKALEEGIRKVISDAYRLSDMSNNCEAIPIQEHCKTLLSIYKATLSGL